MEPDTAYLDQNLYLPKNGIPVEGVKNILTLVPSTMSGDGVPVVAYEEHPHHLQVPRAFLTLPDLLQRGRVIDVRPAAFSTFPFSSHILPRDDIQRQAMSAMENAEEGGILELACGKGKTIISLETIARLGLWAMVVVNTTSLLKQWADAAYEFLGYEAGIIQQDVVQWRPLTIAMIHTLATGRFHTAEELKHYGAVFFDEAHHLAAPTFNQVCPLFYGRRYGLTATKKRADGMESLYMYHLGPNIYSDLTMQEIPYVYFVRTGLQLNEAQRKSITRKGTINQSLLQGLLGRTPWRNALILELIADLRAKGRKILVLGHLKDHLRLLHTNCPGSGLVIGDVDPNERAAVVDQSDVTFGTIKLAAEGFDAPALDTLIVMTPFSHEGMVQQALGRISRTMAGKQRPEAYFIEDRIKSCVEMMVSVRHYLASVDVGSEFLDYARSLEPMYREMAEEFDQPLTY